MQHSQLLTHIDNTFRAKRKLVSRVIKSKEFDTFTSTQQDRLLYLAGQMDRHIEYIKDSLRMIDGNYENIRDSLRQARHAGKINVKSHCLHEMTCDTDEELLAMFECLTKQ